MSGPVVVVEAPARLHFGLLDLRGDLGRRFGGLGAALETPRLVLEARAATTLSADGPDHARVLEYARRVSEAHRLPGGAAFRVRETLPAHSGLGSGTQLALATARALAELHGLPHDPAALAAVTGRARRSAIGTWAFARGGFVLEGGRRVGDDSPAPLLLRHPMPESWRVVLALPAVARGLSGSAEDRAFREMPAPSADVTSRAAHVVLMQILPALVEADLAAFGRGVTELQRLVGEMFRPVQGERFAHPLCAALVTDLLAAGACGAGQSSWGPAVFGLAAGDAAAGVLAERARSRVGDAGRVLVSAFSNSGARVQQSAQHERGAP